MRRDFSLYVITDRQIQRRTNLEVVEEAIAGGASVIQLREKHLSTRAFLEEALLLRECTKRHGVLFIVNDRVDIALASGADGVHLGPEDMPLEYARRIAPHLVIGYSCDTKEEAQKAVQLGADYLGVGTVFPTTTKKDAGPPIGLERLREIAAAVTIPVVAIGGITLENVDDVLETGVSGVAVVSAIVGAPSVREATRAFRRKIDAFLRRTHGTP